MQSRSIHKAISGTLLIAGTTIGAGMLGIPLLTAKAGFWPAVLITAIVWVFMVCTGLLYLEATLWMHHGANVLSISRKFLGRGGKFLAGGVYLFLYYCLMVAYFAAGAPIFSSFLASLFSLSPGGAGSYLAYGLVFGSIVAFGLKIVDRVNYVLMIGMLIAFAALLGAGAPFVNAERLSFSHWPELLIATPILFSAFGFHNVIPSLTIYFHRDVKVLRCSIIVGTALPLLFYLIWQWLIIGALPPDAIQQALSRGLPATAALNSMAHVPWMAQAGNFFAFFAIITSMLGVAFSMVDFIRDGLNLGFSAKTRGILTAVTFFPPFLLTALDPNIFITALGFAGGFGEAFLNGLLPVAVVWVGRYAHGLRGAQLPGGKWPLVALFSFAMVVVVIEFFSLF